MKRNIILIAIALLFSTSLYATELGFGIEEEQNFDINKSAGNLLFNIEGMLDNKPFLAQVKEHNFSGIINLNVNDVSKTTAEIKVIINDILNPDLNESYNKMFIPLLDEPQINLTFLKFEIIDEVERDNVLKKLNVKANGICVVTINGVQNDIKIPLNMIFMNESAFTAKRGPGNIIEVRGQFDLNLEEFGIEVPEKSKDNITISFNFAGNTGN